MMICIFFHRTRGIYFFAELLKCNHEKTFPIYYSFKEVISIETSIPMDSVKVYAMYRNRIHYFYLQTQ